MQKNNYKLSCWYNRWIKFVFDMVLTLVGTIIIAPFLLILCLIVCIDNHGHVIFKHKRVGKDGREFYCYKFQTMVGDAEVLLQEYLANNPEAKREWEENYKLLDDPRVTKLGGFLRRTSMDELPQIFNVLKGEMSLVGPRPIVKGEVRKYGRYIEYYYMVRPGITGVWQTSGRSDTTYRERVAMDTWYVQNWSMWLDLKYLSKTCYTVLRKEGAY